MKYLFLFTISPVQSFISQARKTHDLFSGSEILSQLIRDALKDLLNESSGNPQNIIFPCVRQILSEKRSSLPNRFIIQTDEFPEVLGERLIKTIQRQWIRMVEQTFASQKSSISLDTWEELKTQVVDYFSCRWVAVRCESMEYKDAYQKLVALLISQKYARSFTAQSQSGGRNCSVCGERVFFFYPEKKMDERWVEQGKKYGAIAMKQGSFDDDEALCGVCFTKRHYQKREEAFSSTAGVALMEVLQQLNSPQHAPDHEKFRQSFEDFDAQLYFEENLTRSYLKKHSVKKKVSLSKINERRKRLLERLEMKEFPKHYALVRFDGDNMGQWLSCEDLPSHSSCYEFHKAFSEKLFDFARKCQEEIEPPVGKTIYAGGDDYLGLFCLHQLFPTLWDLKDWFDALVGRPLQKMFDLSASPTFSCGVVIAHYKQPLSDVVQWTKMMEKSAKEIQHSFFKVSTAKNALALAVMKHSGEMHQALLSWRLIMEFPDHSDSKDINPLQLLFTALADQEFSDKFIHRLDQAISPLMDKKGHVLYEYEKLEAIVAVELKRLLRRAYNIPIDKSLDIDHKEERVNQLHGAIMHVLGQTNGWNLLQTLHLVNFLARLVRREKVGGVA